MSRQEDFDTQSDKYVEMRKSFGVNDPYALKEIGEAHYQGSEHGYQYAVDKACEWLKNHSETDYYELIPNANYCGAVELNKNKMIEDFRKAMQ